MIADKIGAILSFPFADGKLGLRKVKADAQGQARAEPALKVLSTLQPELSILVCPAAPSYS